MRSLIFILGCLAAFVCFAESQQASLLIGVEPALIENVRNLQQQALQDLVDMVTENQRQLCLQQNREEYQRSGIWPCAPQDACLEVDLSLDRHGRLEVGVGFQTDFNSRNTVFLYIEYKLAPRQSNLSFCYDASFHPVVAYVRQKIITDPGFLFHSR